MASTRRKHEFYHSGPSNLRSVDWTDQQHRRIIMASLVEGMYVLERDREEGRQGSEALAPPWWESFGFCLEDCILKDGSNIFGAILKFRPFSSGSFSRLEGGPQYVAAFRGTMLTEESRWKDALQDARCAFNTLHRSTRTDIAFRAVKNLVQPAGPSANHVWLAGHSLGAAIAMVVGKKMAREGHPPSQTYLFNPPLPCSPMQSLSIGTIRDAFRVGSSLLNFTVAVLGKAVSSKNDDDADMFDLLSRSTWLPVLFVNRKDPVCRGFISYFERRTTMINLGLRRIENISMRAPRFHSFKRQFFRDVPEPLHVLPSATLVRSLFDSPKFWEAHGLKQWYRLDLQCESERYSVNGIMRREEN